MMCKSIIRTALCLLLSFSSGSISAQTFGDDDQGNPSGGGAFGDDDQKNPTTGTGSGDFTDDSQQNPSTGILIGDANSDGIISLVDAKLIMEYFLGKNVTIDKKKADYNGDGRITMADANAIVNLLGRLKK